MSKTWTATDIQLGKLTIRQEGSVLHIERRYIFMNGDGNELAQIAGGRVVEEIEMADIPKGILSALHQIDQWTKAKALAQEEM